MQSIAAENNLSETAFFVPTEQGFHIRWFTPLVEVDLCGHATLAAAYVIYHYLDYPKDMIQFDSKSGLLTVSRNDDLIALDFPAQPPSVCQTPPEIEQAFGIKPLACLKSEDYIVIFEKAADVLEAQPNYELLKGLDLRGVIITAASNSEDIDFIARFFAPKCGINEDPVTGSAYTQLTPYWAEKLNLSKLKARQMSARGGHLFCELVGDRVKIAGKAISYLTGEINITP